MSRLDLMKSWVRVAADLASDRVLQSAPVATIRHALEQFRDRKATLSEETLGAALAHAEGVQSASVSLRSGRLFVDADLDNGSAVQFSLAPSDVRFAPRGAKEICFVIEPKQTLTQAMPLISALAGLIAKSIWPMLMPIESMDLAGAIVDRDGDSGVRVDLRSVPAIRQAISRGSLGMVVDVLEAEAIVVEANQLSIKLRLPQLHR